MDPTGDSAISVLKKAGLTTRYIQRDTDRPTGEVLVTLGAEGIPDFTIVRDVAWDNFQSDATWHKIADSASAVCFGSLAQRSEASRRIIRSVLNAARQSVIVFDVNLRQDYFSREIIEDGIKLSHILKLNDKEAANLQDCLDLGCTIDDVPESLLSQYNGLQLVCVTMGSDGSRLVSRTDSCMMACPRVKVRDTVGCGDAFSAALVTKYLEGCDIQAMCRAANVIGAFVASQEGGMPDMPSEIIAEFKSIQ